MTAVHEVAGVALRSAQRGVLRWHLHPIDAGVGVVRRRTDVDAQRRQQIRRLKVEQRGRRYERLLTGTDDVVAAAADAAADTATAAAAADTADAADATAAGVRIERRRFPGVRVDARLRAHVLQVAALLIDDAPRIGTGPHAAGAVAAFGTATAQRTGGQRVRSPAAAVYTAADAADAAAAAATTTAAAAGRQIVPFR